MRLPQISRMIVVLTLLVVLSSCGSETEATNQVADETPAESSPPAPSDTAVPLSVDAQPQWTQITASAPWQARAGLRVLERDGSLFLLGGRTPNESTLPGDSRIWSDVWRSDDRGETWTETLATDGDHWAPRAYFQAAVHKEDFFVLGGQDYGLEENPFCALLEAGLEPPPGLGIDPDAPCPEFLPTSQFFNDVWRSRDGVTWTQATAAAPWDARAGLSVAVLGDHIYVLGGSQNDDSSIIGAGGPARIYFNDVWRSVDGVEWESMTDNAPWEPRAGAAVVVSGDELYLLGGEDGFTCEPLPDCEPPYFNDVWKTTDGTTWELVTDEADWSPRPGHVCKLLDENIVCFGGFGLIENPLDVWTSPDGASWTRLDTAVWNAASSEQGKYDFDAVAIPATADQPAAVLTFGGDRETFDFSDPENYLRIDNDVWQFTVSAD